MISLYVDNIIAQGSSAAEVNHCLQEAAAAFKSAGLLLHPTDEASDDYKALGVRTHGVASWGTQHNRAVLEATLCAVALAQEGPCNTSADSAGCGPLDILGVGAATLALCATCGV